MNSKSLIGYLLLFFILVIIGHNSIPHHHHFDDRLCKEKEERSHEHHASHCHAFNNTFLYNSSESRIIPDPDLTDLKYQALFCVEPESFDEPIIEIRTDQDTGVLRYILPSSSCLRAPPVLS